MDHLFWEIQDGNSASFWNDSWKQLLVLNQDPIVIEYKIQLERGGLVKVADYWNHNEMWESWRSWKSSHDDFNIPPEVNLQRYLEKFNSRKIQWVTPRRVPSTS
jgi:hypothetical protein